MQAEPRPSVVDVSLNKLRSFKLKLEVVSRGLGNVGGDVIFTAAIYSVVVSLLNCE